MQFIVESVGKVEKMQGNEKEKPRRRSKGNEIKKYRKRKRRKRKET